MIPARSRLRRSVDFAEVVRRGRRAGRRTLVVHLLEPASLQPVSPQGGSLDAPSAARPGSTPSRPTSPPQFGFTVGRSVGGSVVRHRVQRRLRALAAEALPTIPPGVRLVIRALPPAATATSRDLGSDLAASLQRLLGRSDPAGRAAVPLPAVPSGE
ncbi:MAG: ribonuclease P protein component [Actinomycetota bacterium]|nr:MAG: ribonuclease P protein component [Actinomycetota bacterium]